MCLTVPLWATACVASVPVKRCLGEAAKGRKRLLGLLARGSSLSSRHEAAPCTHGQVRKQRGRGSTPLCSSSDSGAVGKTLIKRNLGRTGFLSSYILRSFTVRSQVRNTRRTGPRSRRHRGKLPVCLLPGSCLTTLFIQPKTPWHYTQRARPHCIDWQSRKYPNR